MLSIVNPALANLGIIGHYYVTKKHKNVLFGHL